jgi:tRNA(fMet)-specific endonuclease VapC
MGALIDTTVWIDAERGRIDLTAHVTNPNEDLFLSVVTVSELLHGLYRAKDPKVSKQRSEFIERIVDGFNVIPIDVEVARTHSAIRADLASSVTFGLRMISANQRDFRRVSGLEVDAWGI